MNEDHKRWLSHPEAVQYIMKKFDVDEETAEAVLEAIREKSPQAFRRLTLQ